MDPLTILAAFAPVAVDGVKALINRFLGTTDFKPTNVDDFLKMKDKELERFKAINTQGSGNPSYLWVEAVVRLQRPFVAVCVLATWAVCHLVPELLQDTVAVDNAAAIVGFYLFGDRTLFYTKRQLGV